MITNRQPDSPQSQHADGDENYRCRADGCRARFDEPATRQRNGLGTKGGLAPSGRILWDVEDPDAFMADVRERVGGGV